MNMELNTPVATLLSCGEINERRSRVEEDCSDLQLSELGAANTPLLSKLLAVFCLNITVVRILKRRRLTLSTRLWLKFLLRLLVEVHALRKR